MISWLSEMALSLLLINTGRWRVYSLLLLRWRENTQTSASTAQGQPPLTRSVGSKRLPNARSKMARRLLLPLCLNNCPQTRQPPLPPGRSALFKRAVRISQRRSLPSCAPTASNTLMVFEVIMNFGAISEPSIGVPSRSGFAAIPAFTPNSRPFFHLPSVKPARRGSCTEHTTMPLPIFGAHTSQPSLPEQGEVLWAEGMGAEEAAAGPQ